MSGLPDDAATAIRKYVRACGGTRSQELEAVGTVAAALATGHVQAFTREELWTLRACLVFELDEAAHSNVLAGKLNRYLDAMEGDDG